MNHSISLKLTHGEISAFAFITWNAAAMLLQSKADMCRLAGWHIHKLHHRLTEKCAVNFRGKKAVRLNLCEVLSLHQYINLEDTRQDYIEAVRMHIFNSIDRIL